MFILVFIFIVLLNVHILFKLFVSYVFSDPFHGHTGHMICKLYNFVQYFVQSITIQYNTIQCNNYGHQAGYLLEETIQVIIYNYNEKVSTHMHMSVFLKMYAHEIKTTSRVCGNIFLTLFNAHSGHESLALFDDTFQAEA